MLSILDLRLLLTIAGTLSECTHKVQCIVGHRFNFSVQAGQLCQPATETENFLLEHCLCEDFVLLLVVCSLQQHDLVIWDSAARICPNVHQRTLMCPFYAQYAIQRTLIPCVPLARMQHLFSLLSKIFPKEVVNHRTLMCPLCVWTPPPAPTPIYRIWNHGGGKKSCGFVKVLPLL